MKKDFWINKYIAELLTGFLATVLGILVTIGAADVSEGSLGGVY